MLVKDIVKLDIRYVIGGTRYRNWLRHYAASRKVAGSRPNEVIFEGVLINENPNQGVRERKKVGIHWST
jgi:hypothetical protein